MTDDADTLIEQVQQRAAGLRVDAEAERAKGDAADAHDEHTRKAAEIDWHAGQCDRAIQMYRDALDRKAADPDAVDPVHYLAELRSHTGVSTEPAQP